ncbi:MAG TPA: hypothetical protein GXZ60_02330 [Intrasporangiaceae bacterium]|nr:hypothetical protein [Intrasporangiaceae bacterium]
MPDPTPTTQEYAVRTSPRMAWTSVLAALSLFAVTTVGQVVELVLKSTNPDDVDVTQGLAYLRPLLLTAFVLLAVAVPATVAAIVRLGRIEGRAATRLPWTLFAVQVVLWLIYVVARGALGPVIDG